ncbi:ATP-binding protein [Mycobacteroides salmoniphilum]|uniref:AAA-like domain protein n=1 Tax=Mycobacteroides salmoniphilum TaxID=404941 RepID=A0A4R8T051_9MYCO|nr:ATP-binding protein [Mycobacteroides salmoniphilum]TEA09229.1 AAA-like domain protein [Mycobacteroides salmoniphilum]
MTQPTTQLRPEDIQATTDIVEGNLRCTARGYFGEFRITDPFLYGDRAAGDKIAVKNAHELFFSKILRFDPLFGGFLRPDADDEILDATLSIGGDDGQQLVPDGMYPLYEQMAVERIDDLAKDPSTWPRTRTLLVAFPLGKTRTGARHKCRKILSKLPVSWTVEPAQPHDMAWLWEASIYRGIQYMPSVATAGGVADFTAAHFDPGAKEDDIEGYSSIKRPAVVKITPDGSEPSYQIVLKAKFPVGEMAFPGGTELFTVLDRTGIHADWALICKHIPHAKVVGDNQDARKVIESNKYETALEPNQFNDDVIAEALLEDYEAKTTLKKSDSVWYTLLIAVGGPTLEDAEQVENILSEVFSSMDVTFERIAGIQEELWAAMLPGTTVSETVTLLGDELDIPGFAEMVPFTHSRIGSKTGPVFGRNIRSGLGDLFRINKRAILKANKASNLVLSGGLGAGKTSVIKTGMWFDAALGDPFAAYDRSSMRELSKIAELVDGNIILNVQKPRYSIDSFKTYAHDPALAGRHAFHTLKRLCSFETGSPQVVALAEVTTAHSVRSNQIVSNRRLIEVLCASDDEVYQEVGRHLKMWATFEFTRALFDDSLPPVDYRAPAFIVETYGMPTAEAHELYDSKLASKLSEEKLYMEAVYEVTGYALKEEYFKDEDRYCSIYLPEAWHLASKPVGASMINDLNHDARKHGCMLWMDSHMLRQDFTPAQIGLIGMFMVGAGDTTDEVAMENLSAAGMYPEVNTDFFTDLTRSFTTGQFFVNYFKEIGAVETFLPTDLAARAAMNTTPTAA